MTRAERRQRKRHRKKWRSRAYRFGWYYGGELKQFGEPPKPMLYALTVVLLPVALLVGAIWVLLAKPVVSLWRYFAKPT